MGDFFQSRPSGRSEVGCNGWGGEVGVRRHNSSHAGAVRVSMLPFQTYGNVSVSAPRTFGLERSRNKHTEANEEECYS